MLSLSELPLSEGESGNIQGWLKERDDLLTTVESLKRLITHMQIKVEENLRRHCTTITVFWAFLFTCVPFVFLQTSGNEDWRAKLLDAVRRVFLSERNVLKSALYRQLGALDTSDALIHLNQLEQRLVEQVSVETSILTLFNVPLLGRLLSNVQGEQNSLTYHF